MKARLLALATVFAKKTWQDGLIEYAAGCDFDPQFEHEVVVDAGAAGPVPVVVKKVSSDAQ